MFRCVTPAIANSVAATFTYPSKYGEIPDDWRKAVICSIYKSGNTLNLANYRPIVFTSIIGKQLQHNVTKYVHQLSLKNIPVKKQYGCRLFVKELTPAMYSIHLLVKKSADIDAAARLLT